jgi:hypothetical protein
MTLPASLVRRRAAQALIIVVIVTGAPIAAGSLWPESAKYVPPPLLLLLVLLTVLNALLAWRAEWLVQTLFPGHVPSVPLQNSRKVRISAGIGLLFSAFLSVLWVKSLI